LDQKRSQELVKKQREAQKESINVAKQAAEERKKIEEEALKNMLDDITKYTPKNAAEWENMMNSINNVLTNYGIPRIVGAWTDGMSMFQRAVDEVTQDLVQDSFWQGEWIDTSIYQWINRMFGVPLQSLIKAMKEVGSQAGAAGGAAATSAFDSNFNPAGTEDQLPGATGEPGKEVDTGMRQTEHYGSFMKQDVGRYRAMVQFIRGSKYNPEVVMKALSDTGFAAWLKGAKTQRTMNAKDVGKLGLGLPALPVSEAYIDIIRRSGINPESPIPVSTGPAGPAGPGKTSQLMPRAERDAQRRGRFLGRYQTAGANQDRAKQMLAALRSPILPEEKRMREQYDTWREKQRKEGKNDSMVAFLREGLRNKDNRLPAPPKGMKYDRNGNLVVREGFIPVYDEQGNLIGYDKATGRGGRGNQTPTTTTTQPKPTTTTQPKPTTTTNAPTTTTTTPKPPRLGRAIRMGMMNAVSKGIQPRPGSTPDFSDTKAGDDIPDGFYPDGGSAYLGKDGKWTRKKPSVVREQRDARRGRTQGGVGVRGRYPTNTAPIKFPKPITAKEVNDALANPQSLRGSTGAGTRHGKNFADGVKQGITNNTKGLRSPLLNMVDFMDTTTGTGMEARSPSRRAAKFGRFWASGIAMGLLSDDSVETLRKAINGLINPFLDLTRSGRLKINFEVATGGIESGLKKRLDEILGGDFIFNKGGFKDLTDFLKRMASYMGGLLDALDKLSGFKGDFKKGPIAKGYGDAMKSIGLASGGIVKRRTGGIMANIGEGRYDEAVIPLPRGIDSFLNSFQPARASMSSFEGSMKVAMTAALKECAPYMGGQSGGQDINIYVDNFIGQPQWFESMMSEYGVKVAPNKQRSYGTINRRVTSYQDNNYRTGRI
jgi:hypothetical protein